MAEIAEEVAPNSEPLDDAPLLDLDDDDLAPEAEIAAEYALLGRRYPEHFIEQEGLCCGDEGGHHDGGETGDVETHHVPTLNARIEADSPERGRFDGGGRSCHSLDSW